jgi:hypothetical protein
VASDPLLKRYDVMVIDEVHERHVFCDFLLGILQRLSVQRPNLKIGRYRSLFQGVYMFSSNECHN